MNKEKFIKEVNQKIENITLDESKEIITSITDKIPSELYEKILCIIDDKLGNTNTFDINKKEIDNIFNKFNLIEEGELSFKSYSYETGEYEYYDEIYDTEYDDPDNISDILNTSYKLGITLVNKKQYKLAQEIFDLIINTNYQCLEMGDPDYDFSEEIYDIYNIDLSLISDLLNFKLKDLYSYAIYTTYFINNNNKYYKIYNYLKDCKNIKLEDVYNLGIERMTNLDNFYKNFTQYLTTVSEKEATEILKNIIDSGYIDEYKICKDSLKNHSELYLNYILKLSKKQNYQQIIDTIPTALEQINNLQCKNDLCYIMVDTIKLSKQNIDKKEYLYKSFLNIHNLPNFLVILYHKLYDNKIKTIVDSIEYKNEEHYLLTNKIYIEDKILYDFFLADFKTVYNKYNDKNKEIKYLMMLYLNNNIVNSTKAKYTIINYLTKNFTKYHYKNLNINENNKELELLKLFNNWKNNNKIDNDLKIKFINKLKTKIESETEYILKNKIRSSYFEIALEIVMLDEILASNNIINKGDCINEYEKKYIRFNAFRKEIKELLYKIED